MGRNREGVENDTNKTKDDKKKKIRCIMVKKSKNEKGERGGGQRERGTTWENQGLHEDPRVLPLWDVHPRVSVSLFSFFITLSNLKRLRLLLYICPPLF